MISACAIVLVCLSFSNCTKQPLIETPSEQLTEGEKAGETNDPDSGD
ncbi:hypothetical protein C8D94_10647 [Marinirhabdus gelatinilytica]|uniref:Uncharacterized protein n=1 Tax=Marinirhabdus gelatinilytica TaxID=1703343 RepID=A0A370Q654_9FLAO|nr:hypothetical protein C8D94_10647 [Marinirhabdus gelatinilytica]